MPPRLPPTAREHLGRRRPLTRTTPPARLGHRAPLDGVRGIAILGVLAMHGQTFGAFSPFAPGAHLGVTVFFVLSGFLITTLLLEEHDRYGAINMPHFYLRRAARLLPALLVLLPFHALVWTFEMSVTTVALALTPMLLYVTNLVRAWQVIPLAGNTFGWSLAIEEQFYLGWPPLLKRTLERGRTLLVPAVLCLGVVALATSLRVALIDEDGWKGWVYFSTFTRIDAMAVGCLAALLRWRYLVPAGLRGIVTGARSGGWVACGVLGYAYAVYDADHSGTYTVGLLVASAATATLLLSVLGHPSGWVSRLLAHPLPVRLGVLSYGLYLWNLLPFQAWRIFSGEKPGAAATVTCLVLGYGAAELSHRYVERPVMRWARARMRRNERPVRSTQAPAPRMGGSPPATEQAAPVSGIRSAADATSTPPTVGAGTR